MGFRGTAWQPGYRLVRFTCERHLGEFGIPAPEPGTLAWCHSCADWRKVTQLVTNPNLAVCGKRARWAVSGYVVEVVCTEPPRHEADKHYDESYSAYFPDCAGRGQPSHDGAVFTNP